MTEHLSGRCLCGAITYRAEAPRTCHYVCHCADCRRYGGAAGHYAIIVAAADLHVAGDPRIWTKPADSGRTVARYFCGACGGHLFTSPWPEATRFSIKAGTLDDPEAYRPDAEIWAKSRVPWARLAEDGEVFEEGFPTPSDIGA